MNPSLSGPRLVVFLHNQPCCVPGRRAEVRQASSLWGQRHWPLHIPTYPPPRHCTRSLETQAAPTSLKPFLYPTSTCPRTHLFSWQTETWRPGLPLLSAGPRQGHHVAVLILMLGQGSAWLTRLPLPSKDTGLGDSSPGLGSGAGNVAGPDLAPGLGRGFSQENCGKPG